MKPRGSVRGLAGLDLGYLPLYDARLDCQPKARLIPERIHSDNLSAACHERSSAISGVEWRICLDVVDALKRSKRGKYAGSRRRLAGQVEGETDREQALTRLQGAGVRPFDRPQP